MSGIHRMNITSIYLSYYWLRTQLPLHVLMICRIFGLLPQFALLMFGKFDYLVSSVCIVTIVAVNHASLDLSGTCHRHAVLPSCHSCGRKCLNRHACIRSSHFQSLQTVVYSVMIPIYSLRFIKQGI
jgi:hypothetical protein